MVWWTCGCGVDGMVDRWLWCTVDEVDRWLWCSWYGGQVVVV